MDELTDLHDFFIVEIVPDTIWGHDQHMVIIDVEGCDLRLADDDRLFFWGILACDVAETAGGGESSGEDSQRSSHGFKSVVL